MGAWGPGSFDNDAAADWALEGSQAGGFALVEAALDNFLAADADELDAADAEEAIAAAETVAQARRREGFRTTGSRQVDEWIARLDPPPAALRVKARDAIRRIREEPSELCELWSASEGFAGWRASVGDLLRRLDE